MRSRSRGEHGNAGDDGDLAVRLSAAFQLFARHVTVSGHGSGPFLPALFACPAALACTCPHGAFESTPSHLESKLSAKVPTF
jgi:hypothetical protein